MIYENILTKLGIEYRRVGRRLELCCQFHHDENPSAAIYDDSDQETFHCWACEITYDPIQFVQHLKGITYQQARDVLESDFKYNPRRQTYDGFAVQRTVVMLEAALKENMSSMSRTFASKCGELIDEVEHAVRNGKLTEEQFHKVAGNLKRKMTNAS